MNQNFLALENGDFLAAKLSLDNGANVNNAGEDGALLYSKMKICFIFILSKVF